MATRACARCGTTIPTDQYLCADCREERPAAVASSPAANQATEKPGAAASPTILTRPTWRGRPVPKGMVMPSRTQYHGTMFGLIAAAVAVTMAAAVLINNGVGPFPVTGIQSRTTDGVITATAQVRNVGSHPGRARCVATWTTSDGGTLQSQVVQTEPIAAGAATPVMIPLPNLAIVPDDLSVDCK
jgi:hypothetical protein